MGAFWEAGQDLGADLEVLGADSGADAGMEVGGMGAFRDQSSGTLGRQVQGAALPPAVQEHGAGTDGIGDAHGQAVGVADQGGFSGTQQEAVRIAGFSRLEDPVGMDLHRIAQGAGPIQGLQGALDVGRLARIPRGSVKKRLEDHDANASDAKELPHENSASRRVRSSSTGSPSR